MPGEPPAAAQYGLTLVFVALAGVLAFVVDHLVDAPNLTLIFVLPVVVSAVAFGWKPSLAAAVAGVLTFDYFFTQPYFSLRIESPNDLWDAALLLVIGMIVSSVAAESRRRTLEARQAAEQAKALQELAHLVIERRPEQEVLRAAAVALQRAFRAPSVILLKSGDSLAPVATAGRAELTDADREAAVGAQESHLALRAGTYPYDKAAFDFWPAAAHGGLAWIIGVSFVRERPASPERYVDIVRGYVAAAVGSSGGNASG
jgi:K+-sensing histidine kinase KdpD